MLSRHYGEIIFNGDTEKKIVLLVQFNDYLANETTANPQRYNCISCQGEYRKCLHPRYGQGQIEIEYVPLTNEGKHETFTIKSFDDVSDYIDMFKKDRPNIVELGEILFGRHSNICPIPFFDDMTLELFNMVEICQKNITPEKYLKLPAIFIDAANVINNEKARLMKMRLNANAK